MITVEIAVEQPVKNDKAMAARLMDKFRRVFPFALLLVYLAQFAAFIISMGGFERYVRSTDLMPTIAAVELIGEGKGQLLYDINAQHEAQEKVLYPYKSLDEGEILPFIHLPFEALLILPFRSLSYTGMTLVWALLSAGALGASLLLLQNMLPVRMPWLVILVGCALSYQPVFRAFVLGQNSMLVLLGLVLTLVASTRTGKRWDALAGCGLVLATFKPQIMPIVLILFLIEGRWKVFIWFGGLFSALVVACMPLLGVEWPLNFLRLLLQVGRWQDEVVINPALMHNWRSFTLNTVGGLSSSAAMALSVVLTALSILLFVYTGWRVRDGKDRGVGEQPHSKGRVTYYLLWVLAIVTAILIAPHLFPHDLVLLILPGWVIVHSLQNRFFSAALRTIWLNLLIVLYLLLAVSFFIQVDSSFWVILNVSLLAFSTGVLLLAIRRLESA